MIEMVKMMMKMMMKMMVRVMKIVIIVIILIRKMVVSTSGLRLALFRPLCLEHHPRHHQLNPHRTHHRPCHLSIVLIILIFLFRQNL